MSDKVKIFSLGGLDEHGKNMYIVEINDEIYVLDCGLKYPDNKIPGVDALIPNFDYLKENKKRVKGYFISHFHDDKMGALPYIYREIPAPVITTAFTARALEIYSKHVGVVNDYKYIYINNCGEKIINGRKFHFTLMTHSAPFSLACSIYTDQGYITYTSDYVIDFNPLPLEFKMSMPAISELSRENILALLSDSSNADKPGHSSPDYQLTPHVHDYFENSTGRIYCAIYGQNMMNIYELYALAAKTGKTIVCANKVTEVFFQNIFSQSTYGIQQKVKFDKLENINRLRDKDVVVVLINDGGVLYEDIIKFCLGEGISKPIEFSRDDTFIFDCPAVAATEIIATEALDATYKTGCKVIKLGRKEINSMHANEEDIKMMITFLHPKYYIPVSGSFTDLMTNAKIALNQDKHYNYSNIFVLDNGMVISGENGNLKIDIKASIQTGDVMIDGTDIGNVGNNVIEQRNRLSNDGVVIMGVTVSSKEKRIIGGPDVQMRGFVFLKDSENILHTITELFLDQVKIYLTGYADEVSYEDKIIERITRYIRRETGKNPVIIPMIIDLDK